ncbi:unnamed protein product [Blepharisma stoltei]|uniref:Uncharacterized protein n=1 Tax=Blepharisma stoltei TaxID=1481888 RepID=A0AAU9J3H5_9CILI|nr:unnamed protein product [Blepharisma stoltei]
MLNPYSAWERALDIAKHNKKLDEIKKKPSKNIDNRMPEQYLNPVTKKYGHGSYPIQRSRNIQSENYHLLEKIVNIHQKSKKFENHHWSPKSLHVHKWRLSNAKINEENQRIIKRINEASSGLDRKSMEKEFQQFQQYAGNRSRFKNAQIQKSISKSEVKKGKLPPIEADTSLFITKENSKSLGNSPISKSFSLAGIDSKSPAEL